MKKGFFNSLLVAGLILILTGCDSNLVYEESQAMPDNIWKSDDIKTFSFELQDTISPLNMFVNLRTTTDYPYSNIYVFLNSEFPNGTSDKDTLEFLLAKPDGEWLGDNSGTVISFKGLILFGRPFTTSGTYTFQLQHAMREDELKEIIDVGIRLETTELE